jgi:hypothetical protein
MLVHINFNKEDPMSYRILFVIDALLAFLFGLAFLLVPERVLGLFGTTEKYASTLLLARFFGTALLALALVLWFAKDAEEGVLRGVGIALIVGALAGLIVTLLGTFSSGAVIRSNGWLAMLLYVLVGLGSAYLLFLAPRLREQ